MLTGLGDMDEDDQMTFVRHCINADNHAGKGGRKRKAAGDAGQGKAKTAKVASKFTSTSKAAKKGGKSNIVPGSFKILVPGVDGAVDDESFLKGKTFVMTGIFPEVGGGDDDSLGVENLKSMIETFGGKVITRYSKNTSEWCDGDLDISILPLLLLTSFIIALHRLSFDRPKSCCQAIQRCQSQVN